MRCPRFAALPRLYRPALAAALAVLPSAVMSAQPRDVLSDTWTATDALGRELPGFHECGPPRAGRQVGIFYFLWLGEHAGGQGPFDNSKILAADPNAINDKDHPLWGPMHAFHHWGEPLFGYYQTDDAYVLRKHAQMLSDAGIDVIIFDVTNQITYRRWYLALLDAFAQVRSSGASTPQVAFLCPFWDPPRVVRELYRDLYAPGIHPELWYRWEGKPLILADPNRLPIGEGNAAHDAPVALAVGHTLGQSFVTDKAVIAVGASCPTWKERDSAVTVTLYRGGPAGEPLEARRFEAVRDNAWLMVETHPPLPPGSYYLELSDASGRIGWWSHSKDVYAHGQAYADGAEVAGDRTLRLLAADDETTAIRDFFTFRTPEASYFAGPSRPDMWSWLEVHPQHVFQNSRGEKEQMSVGVAQNAVGNRLGSMSEPDARGRSFHNGARDARPGAVNLGLNFAEQWERALEEDPQFVFVTGWNEWIAMRFDEFAGIKAPVMFVDQFDQEHSRDIEPMRGGHGDNYYYQLVAYIRRYKGVRRPPAAGPPVPIDLDGDFGQWTDVTPEFRDDIGDEARRDHPGYNHCAQYTNTTGRNDFVTLKVARDESLVYFYAQTREPITPHTDPHWMLLYIDADSNSATGWQGFDFVVNRTVRDGEATVLEAREAEEWRERAAVPWRVSGRELMLAIPRTELGLNVPAESVRFRFKWADNTQRDDDTDEFILNGDAAPNGRFCYVYASEP
ncbi:MAG TPA: hypothetical protein PLD23_16540 [Armatimonadota bacterium]|nr:hypothetical protein [Armatimonadota bacterium]HQK95116.1 hypothetical protein [Armatimonadota bacterium]